jgi:hypothetical protein
LFPETRQKPPRETGVVLFVVIFSFAGIRAKFMAPNQSNAYLPPHGNL